MFVKVDYICSVCSAVTYTEAELVGPSNEERILADVPRTRFDDKPCQECVESRRCPSADPVYSVVSIVDWLAWM